MLQSRLAQGPAVRRAPQRRRSFRPSFELALTTVVVAILLLLATSLIALQVARSEEIVAAAGETYMEQTASNAQAQIASVLTPPAKLTLQGLAVLPQLVESSTPDSDTETILRELLRQLPDVYALYVGYDDGNFLQVLSTERAGAELETLAPPPGAQFATRRIVQADGLRPETLVFFNDAGEVIQQRLSDPNTSYDPRARPWYGDALAPGARLFTPPYLFRGGSLGYTARVPLRSGHGVVAADILLVQLQQFARSQRIGASGGMALFDDHQHVVAGPDLTPAGQAKLLGQQLPVVSDLADPAFATAVRLGMAGDSEHLTFTVNSREYIGAFRRIDLDVQDGLNVAVVAPTDEFFGEVVHLRRDAILLALLVVLAAIPIVIGLSRLLSGSLRRLAAQAEERSQLILGCVEEGIFGADLEGRVTFINPAGARLLACDVEGSVGKSVNELVLYAAPDGTPRSFEERAVHLTARDGQARHAPDQVVLRRDGTSFHAEDSTAPIRQDDQVVGVVVVFRDISERLRALDAIQSARALAERVSAEVEEKNRMLQGLSSKLSRYLSPQVYESIFTGTQGVALETRRKKLTIFFSDIRNFTETTEEMQAEDLTELLNDYLTAMSTIALEYGATIDKFVGDAILIFFGDPETRGVKEDAVACLQMAIAMQRAMKDFRAKWHRRGFQRPFQMRVGINTGYCNVGNFGSPERMDYTVIGAEVNLASRLEAAGDPDGILLSHETYALVRELVVATETDPIIAKGIHREVRAFRVENIFDDEIVPSHPIEHSQDGLRLFLDPERLTGAEGERAIRALEHALDRLNAQPDAYLPEPSLSATPSRA